MVIRVWGNELLLHDLTAILEHHVNERSQFLQEGLVDVNVAEKFTSILEIIVKV